MKKQIGLVGLGKMGSNIALNLHDKTWDVVAYNRTQSKIEEIKQKNINGVSSLDELVKNLEKPRTILLSLTAGKPTEEIISSLYNLLESGDTIIESGNSFYKNDLIYAEKLKVKGINYIDVGISGGIEGARKGACLMIGGDKSHTFQFEELFKDMSINNSYQFFNGYGAGHFLKMIHNGIEYGMMQSIAEGFSLIQNSNFNIDLIEAVKIYNNNSIIESKLLYFLQQGFEKYGQDLEKVSGTVEMLGEGQWTVEEAHENNISTPAIEAAVNFRIDSKLNPSFSGKVLTVLRNIFGGHSIN